MLSHIHIRDFALMDALTLEFGDGLSSLTGETGAGKSILLDALGLCLGGRAESEAVRPGAERADLTADFTLPADSPVLEWLREQDLDADGDCILRRVIQAGGRSKAYVNGRPTPLQTLRALGERLVDIHGQHAHQSLMRREMQRQLLDDFAAHGPLLDAVAEQARVYQSVNQEIAALEGDQQDYESRLDLLRYQVNELDALELDAEGIAELDAEQRRLGAAGDLVASTQALLENLYEGDGSAQAVLGHAASELQRLLAIDERLGEPCDLLNNAVIQLQEGCDSLRRYSEDIDLDPARLAWVEERLSTINDLARKHRVRSEELPERREALRADLEALENAEERLIELRARRTETEAAYREAAGKLSESRARAAATLNERVTAFIRELGMPGGELRIAVEAQPEAPISRQGLDSVQFDVKTNPGQPFGPVNRIASGGELSRIGLAIQVATAKTGRIPTLVFDEADTGMGGAVAEVVGRKLRQLGKTHQVLCVTHLPQVAAQAHRHYRVSKHSDGDSTRTEVAPLDDEHRIEEIARMLGGMEITDTTLSHAREMVERGQQAAEA